MAEHHHWHPSWYKPEHGLEWERIKEAVRRDWQQTKHDLHMKGGHELNQKGSDTLAQAAGRESIPSINDPNPAKIIGDLDGEWERVEPSFEYGFAAQRHFGGQWTEEVENRLKTEWETAGEPTRNADGWDRVQPLVRRGYDYKS